MNIEFHFKIREEANIHEKSPQVHKSKYFNINSFLSNKIS